VFEYVVAGVDRCRCEHFN